MIPYGLLSQILLFILAGSLTLTYIKPTFESITSIQDRIEVYQQKRGEIESINQKLAKYVEEMNAIAPDDQKRLLTYMPNSVDTIMVPRDIQAIAREAGVQVSGISYSGPQPPSLITDTATLLSTPEPHIFIVDFEGSYDQLKQILASFEQNQYPLEVNELTVKEEEGGFLAVTVKLVTYDRTLPQSEQVPALQ
jgi:hypothetical protein